MQIRDFEIDKGAKFGAQLTPDFNKLYWKYNEIFLSRLVEKINKDNVRIADYSGGNGILVLSLIELLNSKNLNGYSIEIIDLDDTKFIEREKIVNLKRDVLNYACKERYDFSISRYLLHYFTLQDQLTFLQNVYYNLKNGGYFLLVNWVVDDARAFETKKKILSKIQNEADISLRTVLNSKTVKSACEQAGFTNIQLRKKKYSISVDDFYKNRFNLTNETIEKIRRETGTNKHNETQLCLILQKV